MEENENLLKQINDIAQKRGITLTDELIRAIIDESYYVRDFGMPHAERVEGVIIEDIVKTPKVDYEFSDVIVRYSSKMGSYKNNIRGNVEHILVQDWYKYAGDDESFEEYFGNDILDDVDKINELLEDIDDVPYEISVEAGIADWGCNWASTIEKTEIAEKEFVKKMIEKNGIYDGILFLILKEHFFCMDEYIDPKKFHVDNCREISEIIAEYMDDNTINGIKQFLEGLDSSGLEQKYIDCIKNYNLEEEFIDMVHNEEQTDIVPGYPNITLDDIKGALHNRDKGITKEL